ESLLKFVRHVIAVFHEQAVFHRRRFFHGKAIQGADAPEIAWLDPSGIEVSSEVWRTADVRCLGVQLFGGEIDVDEHGESIVGDTMLLLFNADHCNTISFVLPPSEGNGPWELCFDTAHELDPPAEKAPNLETAYPLQPCSMAVFRSALEQPAENVRVPGT